MQRVLLDVLDGFNTIGGTFKIDIILKFLITKLR